MICVLDGYEESFFEEGYKIYYIPDRKKGCIVIAKP